jgi:hypothetical protein
MLTAACEELSEMTEDFIKKLQWQRIRTFKDVHWKAVTRATRLRMPGAKELEIVDEHRARAAWLQTLTLERRAYVHQFEEGLLNSVGFHVLDNFMVMLIGHIVPRSP